MQVLTPHGWEDLGKAHIDLHVIANDLQPIHIHAELEKCIVKGSFVDFIISPQILDIQVDDVSMESMSQLSELTGGDTPSKSGRHLSLSQRFSQKMGLSSKEKSSPSISDISTPSSSFGRIQATDSKVFLL